MTSRELLDAQFQQAKAKFSDGAVPRPPHWGGFALRPAVIEFWQGRPSRLHDRVKCVRTESGLGFGRLQPDSVVDTENQSLEVAAFRVEHVDGVVGRLMQSVQDAHGASSLNGRSHNGVGEEASSTAWLQENVNNKLPDFITLRARRLMRLYPWTAACLAEARLAKAGGSSTTMSYSDKFLRFQVLQSIRLDASMFGNIHAVEADIFLANLQCPGRAVQAVHFKRTGRDALRC